jgi:hypothetical protein
MEKGRYEKEKENGKKEKGDNSKRKQRENE